MDETLKKFVTYLRKHPREDFWEALINCFGLDFIKKKLRGK